MFVAVDHQKLEREARICRLLKHPNIGMHGMMSAFNVDSVYGIAVEMYTKTVHVTLVLVMNALIITKLCDSLERVIENVLTHLIQ